MRHLVIITFVTAVRWCAFGQDTIEADRPGFSNSASLVGARVIQSESGLRLSYEHAPGAREGIALDAMLRFGATSWLELRLFADTLVLRSPEAPYVVDHRVGVSDLQPGVKLRIVGGEGSNTRVAAVLRTSVPTGHPSQSQRGTSVGVR